MYAIFKREFLSYFRTPVGYVAMALFTFISGFVFYSLFASGSVSISNEIITLRSLFIIIVPIITMGMFAEDRKRGTEVLYYTTPVDLFSVVSACTLFCDVHKCIYSHDRAGLLRRKTRDRRVRLRSCFFLYGFDVYRCRLACFRYN